MKIFILFAILATSVSVSAGKRNSVPFQFEMLNPGFRAKTASFANIQSVKLNISINSDSRVDGGWQYTVTLGTWTDKSDNSWYAYENRDVSVNVGDHIYYQSELITDVVLINGSGEYVFVNDL